MTPTEPAQPNIVHNHTHPPGRDSHPDSAMPSAQNGGAGAVRLGPNRSTVYPPPPTREKSTEFRSKQYAGMFTAVEIMRIGRPDGAPYEWGTEFCMMHVKQKDKGVKVSRTVHQHEDGSCTCGNAQLKGLQVCGSVWLCPVCSAKIAAGRRREVEIIADYAGKLGKAVVLLTYTLQHRTSDPLVDTTQKDGAVKTGLFDDLKRAIRYMRSGAAGKRFTEKFGVGGMVRAFEIRWSEAAGWHPHCHELLFVDRDKLDVDALKIAAETRYRRWLEKHNYHTNENTVDVQVAGSSGATIERYLTKISLELTYQQEKASRGTSLSPFQLLDAYQKAKDAGDNAMVSLYAAKFMEYARGTLGRRQMTVTPGLKAAAGVEELMDLELAAAQEGGLHEDMANFTTRQWLRVAGRRLHSDLLDVCEKRDRAGVLEWLTEQDIVLADEAAEFKERTWIPLYDVEPKKIATPEEKAAKERKQAIRKAEVSGRTLSEDRADGLKVMEALKQLAADEIPKRDWVRHLGYMGYSKDEVLSAMAERKRGAAPVDGYELHKRLATIPMVDENVYEREMEGDNVVA